MKSYCLANFFENYKTWVIDILKFWTKNNLLCLLSRIWIKVLFNSLVPGVH